MTEGFDKRFWEEHWEQSEGRGTTPAPPPNPHLRREVAALAPGTALDAGCGEGAEAIWLASQGWQVTAADISALALARASERAATSGVDDRVQWVEADVATWQPEAPYDLVTTHYAHPAMPQLDFYERLARWVAPGGTLLVVGHLHGQGTGDEGQPPAEASATAASVTARLDGAEWDVVTAEERVRPRGDHTDESGHPHRAGHGAQLRDVVVRASRRSPES